MMNYIQRLKQHLRGSLHILVIVIGVAYLSGCDGTDEPDTQALFMDKLNGTWTLTAGKVTVNDVEVTGAFEGLTITFDKNMRYDVVNPASTLWPQSGTFTLQPGDTEALFNIVRDDQIVVTVQELAATTVTLVLQYTPPGGRVKGIGGKYIFKMNR